MSQHTTTQHEESTPRRGRDALSHELWEAFAQSPLSTVVFDAEGHVLAVNPGFERLWGIGLADIPPAYTILTDPQLEAAGNLALARRAFGLDGASTPDGDGEPVQFAPIRYEVDRLTKRPGDGGRVTWTQAHAYPVRDVAGRVERVVLTHLDVSERVERELELRRATEEIAAQRERLARVVSQVPIALGVLEGPEHVFVAVSEAYQRMAPGVELIGRRNRDAFPELVDQGFVALLDRVFTTGVPFEGREVPVEWDADGDGVAEPHIVDFVYQPFRSATGAIEGIVFQVSDMTARAHASQALRDGEARQRRAEARQRFLLGMSDTLRGLDDASAIQYEAARALGEHLGADRVGFAELEPDGEHILVTRNYLNVGATGVEGRHRSADYSRTVLAALRADSPVIRDDLMHDTTLSDDERAAHARLGVGAVLDVPHLRDGALRGLLFVHFAAAHTWLEEEITLVREVAARAWDAVDRARAERALRDSEARYRSLFASIDEGFCVIEVMFDTDGRASDYRFLEANPAFVEQTGLVDAIGRTMRELAPEHESEWFDRYGDVVRTGKSIRIEAPAAALGRWYDVNAFRVGEPEQHRVAVLFRDVGERKRAEVERERLLHASEGARADAEAANRAKSEFLAVMSHELRTPLNAIGGYAELMELGVHGTVTDPQRTALGRIQASQRHLLGLINEVLNYARIDAGAVQYDIADVQVAEALMAAESLVRPQADARQLSLLRAEMPADARVRADREKLQQILLNLLSNAIKFTEPGGTIVLSCAVHEAQVSITVTDNGIGIPARKLDTIFEPFVQVDQRLTRRQEGVGLGLAISRDLARGMGGDIVAHSVEGDGSVFTLTLPRAHR